MKLLLVLIFLTTVVNQVNTYMYGSEMFTNRYVESEHCECCEKRRHGNVIIIAKVVDDDGCEVSTIYPSSVKPASSTEIFTVTSTETNPSSTIGENNTTTTTTENTPSSTTTTTGEMSSSLPTTGISETTTTTSTEPETTSQESRSSLMPESSIIPESSVMPESSIIPESSQMPESTTQVYRSTTTTPCEQISAVTGTIVVIAEVQDSGKCDVATRMMSSIHPLTLSNILRKSL